MKEEYSFMICGGPNGDPFSVGFSFSYFRDGFFKLICVVCCVHVLKHLFICLAADVIASLCERMCTYLCTYTHISV